MKQLYVLRSTVSAYVMAENEQDAKRHVNEIMRWEEPVISVTQGEVLEGWENEKKIVLVYGADMTLHEARESLKQLV
jgi:hypothetical protein